MLINGLIVTLSLYHNNAVVGQDNLVTLVYYVRVALKDRKLRLGGADAFCGDGAGLGDVCVSDVTEVNSTVRYLRSKRAGRF